MQVPRVAEGWEGLEGAGLGGAWVQEGRKRMRKVRKRGVRSLCMEG